jgi:spore maturation protein CgeB
MLSSGYITEHKDFIYQRIKKELGLGGMIRTATEVVIEFKPDLIVYITGWSKDDIPVQLIKGFEEIGIKVLTIAWDTYPGATPLEFRQNSLYNSTSLFCEACSFISYARFRFWKEQLNPNKGVLYLSGNNILKNQFKNLSLKKDIDVAIIGSLYKARIELIAFLDKNLSSIGIKIAHFGGYFDESTGLPDEKRTHTLKRLSDEDYVNVINRSKIVLCPSGAEGQWAVRGKIFEIMSCSTFCLAEDNFDIQQTIPREKLATYRNYDDCLKQIVYFLDHEDERERLAVSSHEWCIQTYDSVKFWQKFFDNIRIGNSNFYNTPFVEHNYRILKNKFLSHYDGKTVTPESIVGLEVNVQRNYK